MPDQLKMLPNIIFFYFIFYLCRPQMFNLHVYMFGAIELQNINSRG